MSQFITTTSLAEMRALGSAAERSLPRLQLLLARAFPQGTGLELAEPVPRKDGSGIDWYTESDAALTRLGDLPPEVAEAWRARLHQLVAVVLQRAAELDAAGKPGERAVAAALRASVSWPGEKCIWIAGDVTAGTGQIVVTAWGHEAHVAARAEATAGITAAVHHLPARNAATAAEPVADQAAAASQAEPTTGAGLWRRLLPLLAVLLLPLAVLLLMAWLLLPACGIRLPFGNAILFGSDAAHCVLAAPEPPAPEPSRTDALLAELAVLEGQLRQALDQCLPPETPPELTPPPEPPDEDSASVEEAQERLQEEGVDPDEHRNAVTLTWDGASDLDLILICPDGKEVRLTGQGCGARHMLDLNVAGDRTHSVEMVSWGGSLPPSGSYRIDVIGYRLREARVDFTVVLRLEGWPDRVERRYVVRDSQRVTILSFEVP